LADKSSKPSRKRPVQTVGRRKEAVARVALRPGSGAWQINGREADEYFPVLRHRQTIEEPLKATDSQGIYDLLVRVRGGGLTGQADAIQLAVARALLEVDEDHRTALRARGLLTRDARVVERKKPGRPKARKRFQFSKR
jgi:small subunit ribosomal protein S9